MEIEDIVKLDEYAGIGISVGGVAQLVAWSYYEEKKANIYLELSKIEYKTARIVQNRMKERHLAIASGLVDRSRDSLHLSKLLNALIDKWVERLDKDVKKEE